MVRLGRRDRLERGNHRADHVVQRDPGTLVRHLDQCSCCLGLSPANRLSRPAIRRHLFAWTARRNESNTGASASLGDDFNADATPDRLTRSYADATQRERTRSYANATPPIRDATTRLLTDADTTARTLTGRILGDANSDADTTERSPTLGTWTLHNWDASTLEASPPNATLRRGYALRLNAAVPTGTRMHGERVTVAKLLITES